ncbi:DUF1992 domain-containing protein [Pullulanibacillus sp. KACC 23026]|uniref:DnaJ family domain-containing protein n=1 Tax=Pullulanibacillus sp. KACC 23026 TaxID=3028315 RepID=UPI0023AE8116|nr:DnaJ family domain-containing protein [Pullulanibacillus sp. KACC 23026]WEG13238.1 DUF1992 domain-containing protein [Pullulanibacillus sp. KACC 23026]
MDENYHDLIGDILKSSGMKDNIQSKGKPLPKNYLQMDVYQNFQKAAKEAGYLPPWLKLQRDISKLVQTCKTQSEVEKINGKIKEYNNMCPSKMQRMLISLNDLERAKRVWDNLE